MIRAFRLLRSAFSAWYYDVFVLIGVNLLWLFLSLLILPLGPATAGLFYVADHVAREEPISLGMFWQGFRRFLGKGWQVMFVLLAVPIITAVNVAFYLNMQSNLMQILGIMWIYVLIFWAVMAIYPFPVLMAMERPALLPIFRNSALLALGNVAFSVSMALLTLLVIALSIFPLGFLPFAFGMFSLLAIFHCKGARLLLQKYAAKEEQSAPGS